ncbi:MAG: hypothetical protein IPJ49_14760 [Candidatus Obscuribacter sp.]|nr:hypothetical protein [Candidatus Obscuribacter sp.]
MDPKQQALVLGNAVPMPVVVRTRPFGFRFFDKAVAGTDWIPLKDASGGAKSKQLRQSSGRKY